MKWVERDGSTPVRHFNINDFQHGNVTSPSETTSTSQLVSARPDTEAAWGDIVQKILPTVTTSLLSPYSPSSAEDLGLNNLVLWTGDGKLGMLGFGQESLFEKDVFEDALEVQESGKGDKVKEMEYSAEMRRALEHQARELRWLRGYGL
jgi:hypothetical protein